MVILYTGKTIIAVTAVMKAKLNAVMNSDAWISALILHINKNY